MPVVLNTSQLTNPIFSDDRFAEPAPMVIDEAKKTQVLIDLYGIRNEYGISGYENAEGKRQFELIKTKLGQLGFRNLSVIIDRYRENQTGMPEFFQAQKLLKPLFENVYYVISQTPREDLEILIKESQKFNFDVCPPGALQKLQDFYNYLTVSGHIDKIIGAKKREVLQRELLGASMRRELVDLLPPDGGWEVHTVANWVNLVCREVKLQKQTQAEFPDIWSEDVIETRRSQWGQNIINYLARKFSASEHLLGLIPETVENAMPKFDGKVSSSIVADYFSSTLGLPCPSGLFINLEIDLKQENRDPKGVYKKNVRQILEDLVFLYFHKQGLAKLEVPELEKIARRLMLEDARDENGQKQVVCNDLFEGDHCVPLFLLELGIPKNIFKGKEKFTKSDIEYIVRNKLAVGEDFLESNGVEYNKCVTELKQIEAARLIQRRNHTAETKAELERLLGQQLGEYSLFVSRDQTVLQWAIRNNKFEIFKKILDASNKVEIDFLDILKIDKSHHAKYFNVVIEKKASIYVNPLVALNTRQYLDGFMHTSNRARTLDAIEQSPKVLSVLKNSNDKEQSFSAYLLKYETATFTNNILGRGEDDFVVMNSLTTSDLRLFHDLASEMFNHELYNIIRCGSKQIDLFHKCTSIVDSLLVDSRLEAAKRLYDADLGGALVTPFALINYRKRFAPENFLSDKFVNNTRSDYKGLIEYLYSNPVHNTPENWNFVCDKILFRNDPKVDVNKVLVEYPNQNDIALLLAYCEQYHRTNVNMQEARKAVFAKHNIATNEGKAFYKTYIKSYLGLTRNVNDWSIANFDQFYKQFPKEIVLEAYKELSPASKNEAGVVASIINLKPTKDFEDSILKDNEITLSTFKKFHASKPAEQDKNDLQVKKFKKLVAANLHEFADTLSIISIYPVISSESAFVKEEFEELVKTFQKFPFGGQADLLNVLKVALQRNVEGAAAIATAKDALLKRRAAKFVDKLISNLHVNIAGQFEVGELPEDAELEAFNEKVKVVINERNLGINDKAKVYYNLQNLADDNVAFAALASDYGSKLREGGDFAKVLLNGVANIVNRSVVSADELGAINSLTTAEMQALCEGSSIEQSVRLLNRLPNCVHKSIFIKAIAKNFMDFNVRPNANLFDNVDYDDKTEILKEAKLQLKALYFKNSVDLIARGQLLNSQSYIERMSTISRGLNRGVPSFDRSFFDADVNLLHDTFEGVRSFTRKGVFTGHLIPELRNIHGKVTNGFFAKCCAQTFLPALCAVGVGLGAAYLVYRGVGIKWLQLDKVYASLELTSSLPPLLVRANPIVRREVATMVFGSLFSGAVSIVAGCSVFALTEYNLRKVCYQTRIDPKCILVPSELSAYVNSR